MDPKIRDFSQSGQCNCVVRARATGQRRDLEGQLRPRPAGGRPTDGRMDGWTQLLPPGACNVVANEVHLTAVVVRSMASILTTSVGNFLLVSILPFIYSILNAAQFHTFSLHCFLRSVIPSLFLSLFPGFVPSTRLSFLCLLICVINEIINSFRSFIHAKTGLD